MKIRVSEIIFIFLGVMSAAIGLKGFLLPNGFFDGGVMGISLLLNHFIQKELSYFIVLINLPFVLIAAKQISKEFALKSGVAIFLLAIVVHLLNMPVLTQDKLLVAIFGGVFLGLGIGLAMRGGAVIDGTEVLAVQVSRKSSLSVGDFIAIFNFILFLCVAGFISLESAMYSILTYAAASKSVDFILSGIEEYIGVTIVSKHSEEIRKVLVHKLQKGVTIYKTEGGYFESGQSTDQQVNQNKKDDLISRHSSKINHEGVQVNEPQSRNELGRSLFCVVTRLEVTRLLNEVEVIDPDAFVTQQSIKDIRGGIVKRRPLHE